MKSKQLSLLVFMVGGLLFASQANAILTLEIDDGSTMGVDHTITDTDSDNLVTFFGSTPQWSLTAGNGVGIGFSSAFFMDLGYSLAGSGLLTMTLTDDFASSNFALGGRVDGNGTGIGTVTANILTDGVLAGSFGLDDIVDTDIDGMLAGLSSVSTVSMQLVFQSDGNIDIASGDYLTRVPEPSIVLLLGAGLLGLGIAHRRSTVRQ